MDDCMNVSPDPGASASAMLLSTARELRAHGHAADAQALAERAVGMLRAEAAEDSTRRLALVAALYAARRWDECRPLFETDLASHPTNVHALGFVGTLAARRGDRARAAECAQRLAALRDPYLRGVNTYWQAEIAAVLGDHAQALARLREAFRQGQPVPTKAHSDPDLEMLRDDPDFKRLMRPRG
jgi:tetratricopeptide (TPR) repeat protein